MTAWPVLANLIIGEVAGNVAEPVGQRLCDASQNARSWQRLMVTVTVPPGATDTSGNSLVALGSAPSCAAARPHA